jgi:ubiquinone/menaquinone biosynthesis C-methylase UbiE
MTVLTDPEGTETRHLFRFADLTNGSPKRALEVGCGDGRLTWRYANVVQQVTGIDLHADDLRIALIDRPANLANKVVLARADALHLPVADHSFDLAIFAWSF